MGPFLILFKEDSIINEFAKKDNKDLVNEAIRFREVLVIDQNGSVVGTKSRDEALRLAREVDLDLLCVSPDATPPVCKIVNYGKFRFEQQKRAKEQRKNQKIINIKEIQLSATIDTHDLETKANNAKKFLAAGDRVKIVLRFRGRQIAYADAGMELVKRFIEMCGENAVVEKAPVLDGRNLIAFLSSKVKK
ncbi:MAG: translation initiation factor IF-3 [Erysipelotrichaceae bacterium]|nr:translation initiation factor IF-3 [Erysipelotrichaceae bacterium]